MSPISCESTDAPSLRSFLAELPEEDTLRIREPMELDYLPTALILELEKRQRTPAVIIENPKGFREPGGSEPVREPRAYRAHGRRGPRRLQ